MVSPPFWRNLRRKLNGEVNSGTRQDDSLQSASDLRASQPLVVFGLVSHSALCWFAEIKLRIRPQKLTGIVLAKSFFGRKSQSHFMRREDKIHHQENRKLLEEHKSLVEAERGWAGQHGQHPETKEEENYRPVAHRLGPEDENR